MNVDYMREFLVLTKHMNFTAAAKELFISQPSLTRHVNALEEEAGARLLERENHTVSLTPAGELAVKAFTKIVDEQDNLLRDIEMVSQQAMTDLNFGMVYYGTSAYYGYPLLKELSHRYPDVHVSTITAQTQAIYRHLHRGTIDVGLTITSNIYGSDIVRAHVDTIPLYAFVNPDNEFAKRDSVTPEELAKSTIILNSIPAGPRHHVLDLFERHGCLPKDVVYLNHIDELLPTMQRIDGIFIGSLLLSAIPQHHQTFIPIDADDFTVDISLAYLPDNDNEAIQKLIECIPHVRKPPLRL